MECKLVFQASCQAWMVDGNTSTLLIANGYYIKELLGKGLRDAMMWSQLTNGQI
jgi:hypothetical protein